jgi:hypothetical protein
MFEAPSYPYPRSLEIDKSCRANKASNAIFNEDVVVSETCLMPRNLSITCPVLFTNLHSNKPTTIKLRLNNIILVMTN